MERSLSFLLTLLGLLTGLAIAFYIANFGNRTFSDDPEQWGQFGDYIGGVLNPLFSLSALLVTIYIARILQNHENNQNDKQIETQKMLLTNEFKYDILKGASSRLSTLYEGVHQKTLNYADKINAADVTHLMIFLYDYEDIVKNFFPNDLEKFDEKFKSFEEKIAIWKTELEDQDKSISNYVNITMDVRQIMYDHFKTIVQ